MKKILFVALAATLLAAGCQKTEVINQVPGESLTFTTAMSKLTKAYGDAGSNGDINLQAQNFKVWVYCAYEDQNNNINSGDVHDGMEALDVTYESTSWKTDQDYYWPGTNKSLDFFAVSTGHTWAATEGDGVKVTIEGEGSSIGSRSLTVEGYSVDNNNPNDDLMVAEFVRQHQGMNDKKVSVHFKHALAKVQFKFTTNATNETIEVKKLTVTGLNTAGKLNVTENGTDVNTATGRIPVSLEWKEPATPAEFTDDYEGNLTLEAPTTDEQGNTTKNDKEFATWLVLPQDISGKTVKIEYDITSETGKRSFGQTFALTRPAEAEIKEGETVVTPGKEAFAKWDINQVVIYTINLSPNKIIFAPSVEEWKTPADNLTDQN